MRVLQITDVHLTPTEGTTLYGVDTCESLERIVDLIEQLPDRPDAILATGDLAEDGSETTYRRLRQILSPLETPVYALPGNHDDVSKMQATLNSGTFHCKNAAEIGSWRFAFVNSQVEGQSHGEISASELANLEANLISFAGSPTLVALHHTPSQVCPAFGCQLKNASEFAALLNQYPGVKAVIAGHTHTASEIDAGGYLEITTPSTFAHVTHAQEDKAVDHEDFWDSHKLDGSRQGFRVLDLGDDGSIRSEVHWA